MVRAVPRGAADDGRLGIGEAAVTGKYPCVPKLTEVRPGCTFLYKSLRVAELSIPAKKERVVSQLPINVPKNAFAAGCIHTTEERIFAALHLQLHPALCVRPEQGPKRFQIRAHEP